LSNGLISKLLLLLLVAACLCAATYCGQQGGEAPSQSGATRPATTGEEAAGEQTADQAAAEEKKDPEKQVPEETVREATPAAKELTRVVREHEDVALAADWQLAELRSRLRFNTPKQMQMGETTRIVLVLARTGTAQEKTPEEVEAAVRKRGGTKGKVVGAENVRSAQRMRARLTGADFKIEAQDSKVQPLTSKGVTSWRWDVTPKKWGKKTLHLSVEALLIVQNRETPITVRSYDRDITVNVTMKQRLMSYANSIPASIRDKIVLAILGVIGTALLGWWRGWWSRIWARIRPAPPDGNPPTGGGT
jgi:hypothetical protein